MAYILIAEDEAKIRHILQIMLELKGHQVDQAENGLAALAMLRERVYDLVISDIKMPEMDGFTLLDNIQKMDLPCPVVFITAFSSVDSAVAAMQRGAIDYITKPFEEERILLTVAKAVGISKIMAENQLLKKELELQAGDMRLVCASAAMKQLLAMGAKVASQADTTVLITGESGTGKELIARYVHSKSPRAKNRFVAMNCAAISPSLVESTLFGHEKGAFTGADKLKQGVFEYASGGTLFLDEIGDLPLEVQAKLLRALQEKIIQRVGGNQEIRVNMRIICATNRDLLALTEENKFRQDLYYRINVFPLHIPPLRERREAIIPIALHFIKKFLRRTEDKDLLTQGAAQVLLDHSWPGNVRELANAVERACILGNKTPVTAEDLGFLEKGNRTAAKKAEWQLPPQGISLDALEQQLLKQAIIMSGNNQSIAAKLLGLSRSKFRTKLQKKTKDSNQ
jgi:DNA-binding NtrC family response regulator